MRSYVLRHLSKSSHCVGRGVHASEPKEVETYKLCDEYGLVGLDHVATDDTVTAYDKSHTPPEDDSLGVADFFLSLLSNQERYGGNDFERVELWKA